MSSAGIVVLTAVGLVLAVLVGWVVSGVGGGASDAQNEAPAPEEKKP